MYIYKIKEEVIKMNDALVKILPKMKKFDAYINDVKDINFPNENEQY